MGKQTNIERLQAREARACRLYDEIKTAAAIAVPVIDRKIAELQAERAEWIREVSTLEDRRATAGGAVINAQIDEGELECARLGIPYDGIRFLGMTIDERAALA